MYLLCGYMKLWIGPIPHKYGKVKRLDLGETVLFAFALMNWLIWVGMDLLKVSTLDNNKGFIKPTFYAETELKEDGVGPG